MVGNFIIFNPILGFCFVNISVYSIQLQFKLQPNSAGGVQTNN